MTARLTLAEAKTRVSALCKTIRLDPERLDWAHPAQEAILVVIFRESEEWSTLQRKDIRGIIDTLIAYQSTLDFDAGAAAERANAVALLREQAATLREQSDDVAAQNDADTLREAADSIERGDRVEEH